MVSYGLSWKLWPNYQDFLVSGPVMLGFVFNFFLSNAIWTARAL